MFRIWPAAILPVFLCLTGCGTLEQSLIFRPRPFTDADRRSQRADVEDARFQTLDGVCLHGWYAETTHPTAVVLYAHGNAGNIAGRRGVLRFYREYLNCSILVFDYRGYGQSEGKPTEEGILIDARAARRWLAQRAGVKESEIVVVGNSLGGAVAVDLAGKDGARGLILENTFTSLPDVVASRFRFLPIHRLMRTQLDSASKIGTYKGPLLQTHGTADRVIPYALGEQLFCRANAPKQFVSIAGGDHNDPPTREYGQKLKAFLESLP